MSFSPEAFRRGKFNFGHAVAGFLSASGLPFGGLLSEERVAAVFHRHKNQFGRTYTTAIVLWAFMSQVLRDGKEASCQSAVARISGYLTEHGESDIAPDTRDYCRARAKLSEDALHELTSEVAFAADQTVDSRHLWKGRHAKLIDGATFMMPDTPRNQEAYPQNPAQKPGIGFPIARFVVVISLATACVMDCAIAKYKGKETGETALLRSLIGCFSQGDVLVADRYYGNYWMILLLLQAGVDVCFRKHQGRHTDLRKGKRLGKHDHVVTWHRSGRPLWMSKAMYESMPETIELREIRYVITQPGRKQQPFVIVTTMTEVDGANAVTSDELADLFGFRWNVELDIRSIKTHLNLNHLRCKTPEMVRKEFWVTMLAYNAIRTTALGASSVCDERPRDISFVTCCQFVLASWDVILEKPSSTRVNYCLGRLRQIGRCVVGNRPGRFEPRVRKKRPSNYNLMMKPRQQLRDRLATRDNSFE